MGNYKKFDSFFDSWNILFLNIPALVLIILSYIWFGLTEVAAIIAVSLIKYLMLSLQLGREPSP